jgi:hypothetical protein
VRSSSSLRASESLATLKIPKSLIRLCAPRCKVHLAGGTHIARNLPLHSSIGRVFSCTPRGFVPLCTALYTSLPLEHAPTTFDILASNRYFRVTC